ncbi:unnamed protein product [Dovyalis caffra]|uniref:Uncharacterized protein n=1 Tax=Dovyalis caffra TaxID=77055 RepID=A0AAV1QN60_9ROSI|nr:unnamed protein product [Dovyalis caffra]
MKSRPPASVSIQLMDDVSVPMDNNSFLSQDILKEKNGLMVLTKVRLSSADLAKKANTKNAKVYVSNVKEGCVKDEQQEHAKARVIVGQISCMDEFDFEKR